MRFSELLRTQRRLPVPWAATPGSSLVVDRCQSFRPMRMRLVPLCSRLGQAAEHGGANVQRVATGSQQVAHQASASGSMETTLVARDSHDAPLS